MIKLFIVGFPRDMEESELAEFFNVYGEVGKVTIVTDKETGESQGYGFLTMTNQIGADRAIAALNGATIDERQISVRIAETKPAISSKVFTSEPVKLPGGPKYVKVEKSTEPEKKKKRPRRQF
jgi:RNA recognition motif-containing protein